MTTQKKNISWNPQTLGNINNQYEKTINFIEQTRPNETKPGSPSGWEMEQVYQSKKVVP